MKKILALVLMGAMLVAAKSQAAINTTPHDLTVQTIYTLCEICHVPHNATGGDRLWRTTYVKGSAGWAGTTTGTLCNDACHGGSPAVPRATINAHDVTGTVMNASSHGGDIADLAGLSRGYDGTPDFTFKYWPNGGGLAGHLECTSCHNVHDNTLRPFLRSVTTPSGDFQDGLCEGCHDRDNTTPLVGTANVLAANAGGNFSQHPSSVTYTGTTNYDPDINLKASPAFIEGRGTAGSGVIGAANPLGGHYVSQDGTGTVIGCVTCHAVHGQEGTGPETDLLALDNQSGTGASSLCQACHSGGAGGGTVGAGGDDHPIDGPGLIPLANLAATEQYEGLAGADWPNYSSGGTYRTVSCVGCHSAHYGLTGTSINRTGGNATWCASCHALQDAAPMGHHSNTNNWAASSVVTCADCHLGAGQTQMTAHQGFAGIPWATGLNFCHECHDGTGTAPLDKGTITANTSSPNPGSGYTLPATPTTDKGTGLWSSHLIGETFSGDASKMRTAAWFTDGSGVSYYSKFGTDTDSVGYGAQTTAPTPAAGDEIVCYSCHNIMGNVGLSTVAAINVGGGGVVSATSGYMNNLLLYPFQDDGVGTPASENTGSALCVGCHNGVSIAMGTILGNEGTYKPGGTHPVTGDAVSGAVDADRTPTTLITTAGSYADQASVPNLASYPAANKMDCDSCHRVHGADAQSSFASYNGKAREFILEQSDAAADNGFDALCSQCHAVYGAAAAQ